MSLINTSKINFFPNNMSFINLPVVIKDKKNYLKKYYFNLSDRTKFMHILTIEGFKPVWKIEFLTRESINKLLRNYNIRKFKFNKIIEIKNTKKYFDFYISNDESKINSVIENTNLIQNSKIKKDIYKATIETGNLLGYPECCSKKFSLEPRNIRKHDHWLYLKRRIEFPYEVNPLMNPFIGPSIIMSNYIPCSMKCKKSLSLFNDILLILSKEFNQDFTSLIYEISSNPFIFYLNKFSFYELSNYYHKFNKIYYKGNNIYIKNQYLKNPLKNKDSIEIDLNKILTFKNNTFIPPIIDNMAIWWYKKCYNPEFWRSKINEMFSNNNIQKNSIHESKLLIQFKNTLKKNIIDFNGFKISNVTESKNNCISLIMHKNKQKILIFLKSKKQNETAYIKTKKFNIQYSNNTPLDSLEKEKAVNAFVKFIDNINFDYLK